MQKNTQIEITEDKPQTGFDIKHHLPIKNAMTNDIINAALQTTGLNQANITRDDLFPSDGDNMTI